MDNEYSRLEQIVSGMKGWTSPLEFNLSPHPDDETNYIDLRTILKGNERFELPSHFNGIEFKKHLITALKISAMKSGFSLIHRSSKSTKQMDKDTSAYLTLQCQHGVTYYGKEKSYKQVFKTKWSRKCDVKCQFRLNLSLHKHSNIWSIHNTKGKNKSTADYHVGHFKMDASHIHTNLNLLPKDEILLAKQCSQLNMTSSNMASLVNIRDVLGIENNWTRHQIYYKNKLSQQVKQLNADASSAEKLIAAFEKRLDTNFLYMTFKPTEGLMLMTGMICFDFLIRYFSKFDYCNVLYIYLFHFCIFLKGKTRTRQSLSKEESKKLLSEYTNNSLTGDGKLLVLFLFNNSREMRLARMHPESWQADTTHGTNSEKKELFTIASLDGNKKAFNVCRAYIPNAQTWVFSLLFNECLPVFFGKMIISRNRLIITDGATNEYVPLILATGVDSPLPNTIHGLCYFHLGVLGWKKHVHPFVTKNMREKPILRSMVSKIKLWVKSWCYDTETDVEYLFSRHLFFYG